MNFKAEKVQVQISAELFLKLTLFNKSWKMNNIYTSFCFYILESQNGLLFFTDSSRWKLKYGLVYYTKILASLLLFIYVNFKYLAFREKLIARCSEYNENILLFDFA